MDNNTNNGLQPDMNQPDQNMQPDMNQPNQNMQPDYNQQTGYAQPDYNQQTGYAQPDYNQQTGYAQPNYNQQTGYAQPDYNQQTGYAQPNYNQQTGYAQPGYNQYMGYQQPGYGYQQPKQPSKVMNDIKNMQNEFKSSVKKMGLSVYCLIGIIGAMLLIVAPFMNFASIHVNEKIKEEGYFGDINIKVKLSDGLNLFELSKASKTVDNLMDEFNVDKDDVTDSLDDMEDEFVDEIEYQTDVKVDKSSVNEVIGLVNLIVKGRAALMITSWLMILSGISLLVFTVINNKKLKLVSAAVALACLIWLMICSSHFFSIMGIGAGAIIIGIILGIISAVKDRPAYNQ